MDTCFSNYALKQQVSQSNEISKLCTHTQAFTFFTINFLMVPVAFLLLHKDFNEFILGSGQRYILAWQWVKTNCSAKTACYSHAFLKR